MMSDHIFFFNKKMVYSSSVSVFITNMSNSIIKSAVFFFPCLKDSIFYLASATFIMSLNIVLISLIKSSQFWVLSSSSSSSSFFYVYMPVISPLRQARIVVILSSVSMTLLLLRNNHIPLHQSLNFVWSLSNHPRSSTIFFSISVYIFLLLVAGTGASAGAVNISMSILL